MSSIPDCVKPDLVFYYSVDSQITQITKTILDTSLLETFNGELYADPSLLEPIGRWATTQTIYDFNNTNTILRTGNLTFFLPEGSLDIINTAKIVKNNQDNYVSPSGIFSYKIVSGSGDFLYAPGILVLTTNNVDYKRKVMVYFNK
jgi:hypothetical protein